MMAEVRSLSYFEDKYIEPSKYPYDAESEPELILKLKEYEPKEYELEKQVQEGFKSEESEPKEFERKYTRKNKIEKTKEIWWKK